MPDDGAGGSLTFATAGISLDWLTIEPDPVTREALDTTKLATTTLETFIPSDHADPGGFTVTWHADPDNHETMPYNSAAETITVTYPVPSGKATGATMAATGFVDSFTPANMVRKTVMECSAHIKFSGNLTFTNSST